MHYDTGGMIIYTKALKYGEQHYVKECPYDGNYILVLFQLKNIMLLTLFFFF